LTILGYDIAYEKKAAAHYLKTLIPDKPAADDIKESIDSIVNSANERELTTVITKVYNQIQQKEDSFRAFFGENYFNFKFTVQNLMQSKACGPEAASHRNSFPLFREDALIKNIIELIEHYDVHKAHVHAGNLHANLNNKYGDPDDPWGWTNEYVMATYLRHDYPRTKNKVYSIEFIYDFCRSDYGTVRTNYVARKAEYKIDGKYAFLEYSSDDSPFKSIRNGMDHYLFGVMAHVIVYGSSKSTWYKQRPI
jgi:hypothetical protein